MKPEINECKDTQVNNVWVAWAKKSSNLCDRNSFVRSAYDLSLWCKLVR